MKIRILDPGFANYTGLFGSVEFVDGVSEEVSSAEAARLGTILAVEDATTGINPSTTQLMVDTRNESLESLGLSVNDLEKGKTSHTAPVKPEAPVTDPVDLSKSKVAEKDYSYTAEDLAALADKEGIAGLRAFAETYDVNDRSISGIVAKMLALKAENTRVPQDPEEDQPEEKAETEEDNDEIVIEGE